MTRQAALERTSIILMCLAAIGIYAYVFLMDSRILYLSGGMCAAGWIMHFMSKPKAQ